ncbi:hypothetical protein Ahy_A09g041428 isoform B [Arachis hypogaea]|uniref:Uncharacterized protein n=1 Tax=Arachis hypogaea TaxID=3818 RepID=A0A445BCQ4_ARAHY|nr:hypothetical protein Ahy_A09g041428 isoform B [Arachis hypogaea]
MPYNSLEVIQVVHPDIFRPEHTLLWKSTIALIYFASIEWHQVDRVLSQLGGVQHIPDPAINIDFLLLKDGRRPMRCSTPGSSIGTRDDRACFPFSWPQILVHLLNILIDARRFLSHDRLLIDPRQVGVPVDAPVQGHVAAPARQQGPNVAAPVRL